MLFPEKMTDFVRTTRPLLICGESLASGKYLAKMAKKPKKLENVFVKHYAPNHMPDPKGNGLYKRKYFKTLSRKTFKS